MSEATNSSETESGLISVANATGVPATLKGKTQRWLMRLVGGTVGSKVVSAGRETWDQVEGRSKISQMLAEEVGRRAVADPEIMERAKAHFMSDLFRKQENLEGVAAEAHDQLKTGMAPEQQIDDHVDEDWINIFARYAESASSASLRSLWGKILAGEIRQSGSFSPRTLRIISEIDATTARDFERLTKFVFGRYAVKRKDWNKGDFFDLGCRLETAGLITGGSSSVNRIISDHVTGVVPVAFDGNLLLAIEIAGGKQFPVYSLTEAGRQLLQLQDRDLLQAAREMAEGLKDHGATRAEIAALLNGHSASTIEICYAQQ